MSTEPVPQGKLQKLIKPQRLWKWEIAIYLYMAGMGAGSYMIGMMVNWFVNPTVPINLFGFRFRHCKTRAPLGTHLRRRWRSFPHPRFGNQEKVFVCMLEP